MNYEFDDDGAALNIISENFGITRGGMIYPINQWVLPNNMENAAINYLMSEWDYGYLDKKPDA